MDWIYLINQSSLDVLYLLDISALLYVMEFLDYLTSPA